MRDRTSSLPILSLALLGTVAALAQTSTDVTFDFTFTPGSNTAEHIFVIAETGSADPLGNATLRISGIAPLSTNGFSTPIQLTAALYFNQIDSVNISFTVNDPNFLTPRRSPYLAVQSPVVREPM